MPSFIYIVYLDKVTRKRINIVYKCEDYKPIQHTDTIDSLCLLQVWYVCKITYVKQQMHRRSDASRESLLMLVSSTSTSKIRKRPTRKNQKTQTNQSNQAAKLAIIVDTFSHPRISILVLVLLTCYT